MQIWIVLTPLLKNLYHLLHNIVQHNILFIQSNWDSCTVNLKKRTPIKYYPMIALHHSIAQQRQIKNPCWSTIIYLSKLLISSIDANVDCRLGSALLRTRAGARMGWLIVNRTWARSHTIPHREVCHRGQKRNHSRHARFDCWEWWGGFGFWGSLVQTRSSNHSLDSAPKFQYMVIF